MSESARNPEHVGVPPYPELPALDIAVPEMSAESYQTFSRKWGVHAELLPFSSHATNAIEILQAIQSIIEEKDPWAVSISFVELTNEVGIDENGSSITNHPLRTYFMVHGAWPNPDSLSSNKGIRRWVNPGYKNESGRETSGLGQYADLCNPNPRCRLPDDILDGRIEWVRIGATLGLNGYQLGRRMDMTHKAVSKFSKRHDIDVVEHRRNGRVLMARTWKTANRWGYSYREIGNAIGCSRQTVSSFVSKHASEFEPPVDPTTVSPNVY